jgi:ATP-dependent DNA helicase PIF1
LQKFSEWILDVGNGQIPVSKCNNEEEPTWINIPHDLLIYTDGPKIPTIVNTVYPDLLRNYLNVEYLKERAIVSPTNEVVDGINMYILTLLPGEQKEYLSADSISKCFDTCSDADVLYPI